MNVRGPLFISLVVLGTIAGCSSEEETNPAPTEPVVFDASAETRSELGIARWGFVADPFEDHMVYRGYGEKNEVLATVAITTEDTEDRHVFTMTMTGPTASASERIEYYLDPAQPEDAQLMMGVTENTFAQGGVPMRVVVRFQEDSAASAAKPAASLLQTGELVSRGNDTVDVSRERLLKYCPNEDTYRNAIVSCNIELIDWRTAAAGESGACALVETVTGPLLGCAYGAIPGWVGGPKGAIAGCLLGGAAGVQTSRQKCADARRDNAVKRERFDRCFRKICVPSMSRR